METAHSHLNPEAAGEHAGVLPTGIHSRAVDEGGKSHLFWLVLEKRTTMRLK